MFQVPAAKRLKRSELFEDVDEREHPKTKDVADPVVTPKIDSKNPPAYHFEFEYVNTKSTSGTGPKDQTTVSDEFTFNLFRPAPRSSKTATHNSPDQTVPLVATNRISIKSPSPPPDSVAAGRFDKPRPDSDYFTAAFSADHQATVREQFAVSAISGESVRHLSTLPWPGSACSWRIIALPAHSTQIVVDKTSRKGRLAAAALLVASAAPDARDHDENPDERPASRRRCRASKKRRIFMRVRAQKRVELQKVEEKRLETEQEKRAQKNRERKAKRRMKEKRDKEAKGRLEEASAEQTPMDVD